MAGLKHKRKQQARKAEVAPLSTTNTPAPTAAPVVGLAPTVIVAPPAERFDWSQK